MGMTKASLDLQIQHETQRAIATLQKNMERLDGVTRVIDGNMRQAHVMMYQDVMQLRVRVNFLLDELKNALPEDKQADLETRFKVFAEEANKKMEKDVAEAIALREKAQEEAEVAKNAAIPGTGSENTPNVIQ